MVQVIEAYGYSVIANPSLAIKHYELVADGWQDTETPGNRIQYSLDAVIISFQHHAKDRSQVLCLNINESNEGGLIDVMSFDVLTKLLKPIESMLVRDAFKRHYHELFIERLAIIQPVRFFVDDKHGLWCITLPAIYEEWVALATKWVQYNSKVVL